MPDIDLSMDFDPYLLDFARDPFPRLEQMRTHCPVAHSDAHDGFWAVTRYEDVRHVALHPEDFSSRYNSVPKDVGFGDTAQTPALPLNLDPPEHTRFRKILTPSFLPARAAALGPAIRGHVERILEPLVAQGGFDASEDFARLVPTATICELLGLPGSLDQFSEWVRRSFSGPASETILDLKTAAFELFITLNDLVAQRREQPGTDLFSELLLSRNGDDEPLTDLEIVQVGILVFFAGIETTWGTLAIALHYLASHPDQQALLRSHPELRESAREEFLRAFAPVSPSRVACRDLELGGEQISAGDMVYLSLPSANHDEREFPNPHEIQFERTPNRHVAFGAGIHRCLGLHIARVEMDIALEELFRRVPPFRLTKPAGVTWTGGLSRRPQKVDIVW